MTEQRRVQERTKKLRLTWSGIANSPVLPLEAHDENDDHDCCEEDVLHNDGHQLACFEGGAATDRRERNGENEGYHCEKRVDGSCAVHHCFRHLTAYMLVRSDADNDDKLYVPDL
jgi:hypothetical protein